MTQFKTLLVLLCAFIALHANAQIANGNISINGTAGIYARIQKSDFLKTTASNLSLNPSFSKFATDKWLVGTSLALNVSGETLENIGLLSSQSQTSKINTQSFGAGINTRYYFIGTAKAGFFGTAGLGFSKLSSTYEATSSPQFKYSSTTLNWDIGIGANVFINPEVSFEPILSYSRSNTKLDQTSFSINTYKNESVGLVLKFNSFVNLSETKGDKETPQFVKIGRQIVGGQADYTKYLNNPGYAGEASYTFSPLFGQFLTDNFLLKAEMNFNGYTSIASSSIFGTKTINSYILDADISGRYYFKINRKFYIYPEVSIGYNKISDRTLSNGTSEPTKGFINYGGGVGGSYFVSNNVAIDVRLLQLKNVKNEFSNGFNALVGAENIRLLYFIR
jgi:Outer membrane protein beta-barrel domain